MSSYSPHPAPGSPASTLALKSPHLATLAGRAYRCKCGVPVFFRNSECLACGTPLGYDPEQARLLPLMPGEAPDTWVIWQAGPDGTPASGQQPADEPPHADANHVLPVPASAYTRCTNLQTPAACNWLVPVQTTTDGSPHLLLCRACRLNRIIPDLNDMEHPDNGVLWGRIELAKRRLVSALMALGLPVASRITEDTQRGMMFDILRSPDNGPHVMTGHDTGLITLNLEEADDAMREAVRKAMREPYRTMLGHFRHEVGHYYWDRLVSGTPWMDGFHELFGDETQDYAASLRQNYEQGPPAEWWLHYVSAYASTHPWEDWAECWAHYLHMRDTIDTALSFGMVAESAHLEFVPYAMDALYQPDHPDAQNFLDFLNDWTRLTTMLNEMSRSMGQPDFYPFVLPLNVVAKLHFIHLLVTSASWLPEDAAVVRAAQQEVDQQMDVQTQTQTQTQTQNQGQGGQNHFQAAPAQVAPMQENVVQNA
ncbi:MAG: putative zinc-binding metallopeptidase [Pseudomonadota bacterium]